MNLPTLLLMAAVVASGLFTGLMLTLVVVMQRIWSALPAPAYVDAMQTFLPAAKGHPIITTITLVPILAPIVALAALSDAPASGAFIAALAGTLLALGPLLVTLRLNFPIYDTIMAWTSPPPGWESVRQRFYRLNLLRLGLMLAAHLCLLSSLALG